jgi:hypothetical protein
METKIKLYKVMALGLSAGLCGSENWVLLEKDKNTIQTT